MPTKPISIRLEEHLLAYLTERAEIEHRSLSNMISTILTEEMEMGVHVVHGEWVHKFGGYVNCSECGASPLLDGEREYVETEYCPSCGAKMDGRNNNILNRTKTEK